MVEHKKYKSAEQILVSVPMLNLCLYLEMLKFIYFLYLFLFLYRTPVLGLPLFPIVQVITLYN